MNDAEIGQRARHLRIDTLIWLRWLAILGQTAATLTAHFALGLQFPVYLCLICIGASVLVNIGLRLRFPVSYRLGDTGAVAVLAYDIAQLAALLSLSGGLANPFSFLFLAPIMTAAVALPLRRTLVLLAFMLACAAALHVWRADLRWPDGAEFEPPYLYSLGVWISVSVSGAFITLYGSRIAEEARQLASALIATELILARQQHLSQLDGVAAAVAHELGTPLATVAVVIHELAAQPSIAALCDEDLRLAEEQIARCRTILGKLSSPDMITSGALGAPTVTETVEEIVAPHRLIETEIEIESQGSAPEPLCRRNAAVIYGLNNLVENAVSFAQRRVTVQVVWTASEVKIVITDDGPGFPLQILGRLGEPYISTRGGAHRREGETAGGLGLGLFIAKALLERSGASLKIANLAAPGRGATASIVWPRDAFEQGGGLAEKD